MIRKYILIITIISTAFLSGCGEEDNYQTRMENERKERSHYLRENGITTKHLLDDGVYYIELFTPANTAEAKKVEVGDDVVVYYTGYLLNGMVFDSNVLSGKFEPLTVRIQNRLSGQIIKQGVASGNVISGWPPALLQMHEGTRARIVVPSNRAYGMYGSNGIPGYSSLVFELEVEEIRKGAN